MNLYPTRKGIRRGWLIAVCSLVLCPLFLLGDDVPVAPIRSQAYGELVDVYVLKNDRIEVVIDPSVGRVVSIKHVGGENLLTMRRPKVPAETWFNYGGGWFFPVAQEHWIRLQDEQWPPPREVDGIVWQARGWKNADGTLNCLLEATFPDPLQLKCSRQFRLLPGKSEVLIKQRVQRLDASVVPAVLWNGCQVNHPDRLVLPVSPKSLFPEGYQAIAGKLLKPLTVCSNLAVCATESLLEGKIGTDARDQWIGAVRGNELLLQQVLTLQHPQGYPNGGCGIQAYINRSLDYADIEVMSPVSELAVGHTIENAVKLSLHYIDPEWDDCRLAVETAKRLGGEPSL
ncbi:MAG: hypothetical protein ACI92G_004865 [Candidatus Pelagisphaera sp.]|jgi:hypothetical protein